MPRILALLRTFAVQRAAVAAVVLATLLFAGAVLEDVVAADLLLIMFLAKFLHMTNLGATNGYLISKYRGDGGAELADMDGLSVGDREFVIGFVAQTVVVCSALLVISFVFAQAYLLGIIAYLIISPLLALEPVLRRRRNFFWSLLPDVALSVALLVVSVGYFLGLTLGDPGSSLGPSQLFLFILITFVGGVVRVRLWGWFRHGFGGLKRLPLGAYGRILYLGLPAYAGTAFFILASGMDRFFLPLHIEAGDRALYLLSYQLTTGAAVFISAMNFVTTVDLGEAHHSIHGIPLAALSKKLGFAMAIALPSLGALVIGCLVLERWILTGYSGLTALTAILAAGLFTFFVAGSITPALQYLRRQWPLTIAMGVAAVILFANNIFAMERGLGVTYLATVSATVLSCYALFATMFALSATHSNEVAA